MADSKHIAAPFGAAFALYVIPHADNLPHNGLSQFVRILAVADHVARHGDVYRHLRPARPAHGYVVRDDLRAARQADDLAAALVDPRQTAAPVARAERVAARLDACRAVQPIQEGGADAFRALL